jgi:D-alanyl-D-alanine carboxypeptidase/D-alanyl-D-alanine-endopeptidase (penicillin-binding protein 4)
MRIIKFLFFVPFICSAQINAVLQEWKNDKDLKNASIGFSVLDVKTGSIVSEYNSHVSLVPASTLKIVTTAAALSLLGSGYRYETKLCYTGTFNKESGILNGDLIVVGNGDPSLQSENFVKDSSMITDQWAKIIKEKGIKKINGKIVADASCFERDIPDTWIWADIANYFGAVPCGLSFMDNKFKIIYDSDETGSKAKLTKITPQYYSTLINVSSNVTASGNEDQAIVTGDPFSYVKEIKGKIPPLKKNFEVEAALPDPALLCAERLCTSLLKSGVMCDQKSVCSNYKKNVSVVSRTILHNHYSPTLDNIVFYTNLKSNNHYCESLLRSLGKGSASKGIALVKNFFQKDGLDMSELYMVDASGLSRVNTVTTSFEANLLSHVTKDSVNYKTIIRSLPVAGKSGSMSNIGKNTFIENNMRAKTGYMNRVRAYCGYVTSKSGKDLAFSVIFNNYNCSAKDAKLKIEKFLVALGNL